MATNQLIYSLDLIFVGCMGTIIVLKYEVILLTTQNNVYCVAIIKTVPRVKLSDHLQKLYFYTNFK